jgi:hypothetical protein
MADDINVNLYDVVAEAEAYFENIDITKKGSGWKAFKDGFMRMNQSITQVG